MELSEATKELEELQKDCTKIGIQCTIKIENNIIYLEGFKNGLYIKYNGFTLDDN